jgi:signal transduction histidine kinase
LAQTTKNGAEIIVACRKTLNDESNAVLEVGRDITAQLRAEEALREAERLAATGRVAGIIAHEINNPLEAITNIFFLLRNHPSLDNDARRFAELAEQELERVSHITRQTLSFYRESKQPISVHLPELLDSVLALQESALQANHVVARRKYADSSLVWGFPVELRQVFLNLIGNAIQAMPDGGVLGIRTREVTDWTTRELRKSITIVDTGAGIRPEDASRLFEPFFSTKSTKGTGLGLWISKGIIQKYEGRISFRSYRHAGGCITCFRVLLPIRRNLGAPVDPDKGRRREKKRSESVTA